MSTNKPGITPSETVSLLHRQLWIRRCRITSGFLYQNVSEDHDTGGISSYTPAPAAHKVNILSKKHLTITKIKISGWM